MDVQSLPATTEEERIRRFVNNLKEQTNEQHLLLESQQLLGAIVQPTVTLRQYIQYLVRMQQIVATYERDIVSRLIQEGLDINARPASQLLARDIAVLGSQGASPLHKFFEFPKDVSTAFALGCMYVMEGSKLGGKVIYKTLHKHLHVEAERGGSYISDHGEETVKNWKHFLHVMSSYIICKQQEEEAIRGAKWSFAAIYKFFEDTQPTDEN